MSVSHPVNKVYITQSWGVNEEIYKRFGFKGHNGQDYRLFDENGNKASTCLVFAPHGGVVKERRNDPDGYGNYLKIENDKEGSILAHLHEFKVNINKQVKKGDLVAIGDNTGWSTGSHLHWGYYRFPRNRNNGYGGTIDPAPYIKVKSGDNMSDGTVNVPTKDFENLHKKSTLLDKIRTTVGSDSATEIKQWIDASKADIKKYKDAADQERQRADAARKELNDIVAASAKALNTPQEPNQIKTALLRVGAQLDDLDTLQTQYANLQLASGQEKEQLQAQIDALEARLKAKEWAEDPSLEEVIRMLIKKLKDIFRRS